MLRHALRRILWTLPTLFVVSVLTFLVLSFVPDPAEDPRLLEALSRAELQRLHRERFLDLPRFVNLRPRDARVRAGEAVRSIAAGDAGAERAAAELRRLGGAALPHVLPALDALPPEPRTRVALALAPVAARMNLPRAAEAADAERAVAFWTRFWDHRGIEFRTAAVRTAVQRLVRYGSPSRAAELRELDTFALAPLIRALNPPEDDAAIAQARVLVDVAAHVTEIDDRIPPDADLAAARACVARWKSFWRVYRGDYTTLAGSSRLMAVILETRYGKWALGAVTQRLGTAAGGEPVLDALARRAPVTLALVFGAIALAYALAVPLGALSAASRNRKTDLVIAFAVLVLAVMPTAVLAVLAAGSGGHGTGGLFLPIALLALALVAAPTRQQRSALAAVLTQEIVRTALAKGASRFRAVTVHGLRNALLPVVTLAVLEPPLALGGAFVIEHVFGLHGLGEATILAVRARDTNWLMALSIFTAAIAALAVIATDLAYVLIDPRLAHAVLSRRRRT